MTDNEIITGLMCHRSVDCRNCTFNGHGCSTKMYTEVLQLLDRLKVDEGDWLFEIDKIANEVMEGKSNE